MKLWQLVLSLLAVLTICSPSELTAQTTTSGALAGVVTDQTGAVVTGAAVLLNDVGKGYRQSTATDRDGVYRFFFLAPGRYTLSLTHPGFREEKRTVSVQMGSPISVNVTLQIAKASTEITVLD